MIQPIQFLRLNQILTPISKPSTISWSNLIGKSALLEGVAQKDFVTDKQEVLTEDDVKILVSYPKSFRTPTQGETLDAAAAGIGSYSEVITKIC